MPWSLIRRDGKVCVVKDSDGSVVGCHDTRAKALAQQRALYARESGMTAALAPLKPPLAWFERPEPDGPTAMTYEDSGEVYGHLAAWGTCHVGLTSGAFSECVRPPQSQTDYARFHLGQLQTQEGEMVPVGKIVLATGHAPISADLEGATRHYDDTGNVGAFVRARNGRHGIWAAGALRSDITEEQLRDLRANPPSGDWRLYASNLELVAALAVPVPGFPIPPRQLALSASGEISALILTEPMDEAWSDNQRLQGRLLETEMTAAVLTAKKRKSLPKTSFVFPAEKRYPIHDRAHAANALARSAGKPEAAKVKAAVCRKYPDMPACK